MNKTVELNIEVEKHNDYLGAKMGMWLFLFTEIMLFGGMFLLYSIYRAQYTLDFHNTSSELSKTLGTLNTFLLLTSSLTMASSISAIKKNNKKLTIVFLMLTIILGFIFLINKYFEWSVKFQHGNYPNSPELLKLSQGKIIFYGLYYAMTGLHGLHIIIGIVLLFFMLILVTKNTINQDSFVILENTGLYWHLVDIIWIYLFPLLYLIT